jgi:hypothetical protein
MDTEVQGYHLALEARISELESQMLMLTTERDDLMMDVSALRGEFKKVLFQREPRDDVPTGVPKVPRNIIRLGKRTIKAARTQISR